MLPRAIVQRSCAAACCGFALTGAAAAAGPDLSLPRVIEQQANVFTSNHQEMPSLDFDASGNAFVVWGSRRQEFGTFGIFGRMFDGAGRPLGAELHINQFRANNQETPSVSFGENGRAWVVWKSHMQDGNQGAIVARRFGHVDGQFKALGDEFIVNQQKLGDQTQPVVAVAADRVMIAWSSSTPEGQQVVGRLYSNDGTPVGDEMRFDDNDADVLAWSPVAAAQQDDGFVVAWSGRTAHGTPAGIHGLRVAADGTFADQLAIAANADRHDIEPSIDVDAEGRFVVTWMASRTGGHGYRVLAQRFSAAGARIGDEIVVADETGGWNSGTAVAVAEDGGFVVTYNVEGEPDPASQARKPVTPSTVMARRFDALGQASGKAFRVNQHDDGRQYLSIASTARRAAIGRFGQLAVAWNGTTKADGNGVGVTMVMPSRWAHVAAELPRAEVDAELLALTTHYPEAPSSEMVPPDYDPNHVPDPPDPKFFTPGGDFGFIGFQNTGWNPPDPDIAVGPNHIVVAVNGGIRFYTKTGTLQFSQPLTGGGGFWGSVGGGGFVFDPVLVFDPFDQRFIAVCTEHSGSQDAYLDIAVSDDDDPNGTWHKYRFNLIGVGGFIDFPNLGVGPDSIYIATDFFDSPTGNHIHRIDKADVLNGSATTVESIRMSSGFRSTGAVKTYDADAPAQYFATTHGVSSNRIGIDAVTGPPGSSSVVTFMLPVPTHSSPPNADQLGSSNRVATVGKRLKNGVYRNGSLWVAHTTGQNSTARVRWYEIAMNGWPTSGSDPSLVQMGTQDLGSLVHNWFADIHVDDAGNAAISFNQSSPTEFVSIQRTSRLAQDASGTLRPPTLMQASTSAENGSRWGDYGGIEEDAAVPGKFWGHHEYRTSSWRTWVGSFSVVEETLPSSFNIVFGNFAFGDVESLYFDDSDRVGINQRAPVSPLLPNIRLEIDGTLAVTNPSQLGYRFQAQATANPANSLQRIAFRDFDTNSWVTVDDRFATLSDSTVEVSFASNFDQYIEDGTDNVRSQISWFDPGAVVFAAWAAYIDQAVWTVTP